ncbi:MAG: hypothetical protein EBU33_02150, partial [Sphingobacteriia bacterium]|nr:hypothetical protein [Sphingobacteriia bacterium]
MSIQISGTSPYRLSSVNWNHPGKTTIVITKVDAVPSGNKEGENRVSNPNVDEYFHVDGIQPQLRNIRMETQNGLRVCYWTYECGITDRLGSPTDRQDKNVQGEQWSMSVDLMEVPIIQHPNGLEICNAHGGIIKGGEIVFSRYVNGVKNPWYGTSGFY